MYNAEYVTFSATINVTYTEGATCTCTLGGKVLTAPDTTGFYAFTVGAAGTWTVKIEKEDEPEPKTTTVEITSNGQTEAVELQFLEIVPWSTGTNEQIAAMMEAHYEGKIDVTDYWAIGDERPVELTTGETVQMILMHEGQYPLAGDMVDTPVTNLPVGTVIQLNENGSPVDYIIIHQGNPNPDKYDTSCDGTWVVRKDIHSERDWDSSNNDYKNSDIHSYLNGTFLNLFDNDIKNAIKQVKIPYQNGTGSGGSVASGANGLSCKIFLLSGYELGWTTSDRSNFPRDGAKLSYFSSGTGSAANNKRIANYNGSATDWWLRSPDTGNAGGVWGVRSSGNCNGWGYNGTCGVRPAFILDPSATVKAYPTCTYVVGMKNCLNELRAINSVNNVGWSACEMRTWLNSDVGFKGAIPADLLPIFKQMRVITANGVGEAPGESLDLDYFALATEKEVFGQNTYASAAAEARLFQFEWYKSASNRLKTYNSASIWYFDRSPSVNSANFFCYVDYDGTTKETSLTSVGGVAPFGCI